MTASTIDPVEETEVDPEMILLLSQIDAALTEVAHRSIVSADEMANLLLDIRVAALALRR